jgi:hypothetical protein
MLFATTALARDRTPAKSEFKALVGKVVEGRCHMDNCSWFSIEAAKPAGQSRRGQLFKITTKRWDSYHPEGNYKRRAPRHGGEAATSYVFCSKTIPAIILQDDHGRWTAARLNPGNSNSIAGATEFINKMYWAACHGKAVNDLYIDGERLAKTLGYNVKWLADDDGYIGEKSLRRPTDALEW